MGTTGDKPENKITISRGGETPARKIDTSTGETDRSFAQPSPAVQHETPTPKAHASKKDEKEALSRNSSLGQNYTDDYAQDEEQSDDSSEE